MSKLFSLSLAVAANQHISWLKSVKIMLSAIAVVCLLGGGRISSQSIHRDAHQIGVVGTMQSKKKSERKAVHLDLITGDRALEPSPAPPTVYIATAYSLRGRTASGRPVAKGLIAADPKHLPLGSRVRLEAGAYSGEYLVADTSGPLRGRRIDIWTPTSQEAVRFGRRTVKLTVLSGPDRSPVKIREDLEKEYVEKRISDAEYQKRYADWLNLADQTVKASASYYLAHYALYQAATNMPAKFGPIDPNEKTLVDTTHERFRLRIDFARKIISEAEYTEKLAAIIDEEKEIARKGALSASDMARYYETTDKIQPTVALLQNTLEKQEGWSSESVVRIAVPIVAILGIALSFYLNKKKDTREKKLFELEQRKLELAEVSSREILEKTNLLLETKQFQIKEMTLRIAQLEQQLGHASKNLVIP